MPLKLNQPPDSEIRTHYEQTKSCIKTGEALGVGVWTVCRAVRRAGGQMRKGRQRFIGPGGYRYIFLPINDPLHHMATHGRCYALEHRVIVARKLGRSLLPGENVHHINGDKLDNRIENLELWQSPQPSGIVIRCNDCGSTNCSPVERKYNGSSNLEPNIL